MKHCIGIGFFYIGRFIKLACAILTLLFFSGRVCANNGYVILNKEKPIEKQLTQKNVVYDIRYDFDLNNATITIPSGCVLRFSGGTLYNGTINLNDCYIEGNANINCSIIGCPSNEDIYTKWFTSPDVELMVLLRNFCSCWYNDKLQIVRHKRKRTIHIEKSTYSVTEGIELRYEQDLTIDFGGSTIIDNIDSYDELRHRASSVISMRESSRINVCNCVYLKGNDKEKKNLGGSFLFIGGPHVNTIQPNYDIRIKNITGTTPIGYTKFIPINVLGNCYNIEINGVTWTGSVASLINLESSIGAKPNSFVESTFGIKKWPYPDYYGAMPYNITIHNINGYNRPEAIRGYIRTGGAYNVIIQNVFCRNVQEILELFQGDYGNARSAMNITISNVCSYWDDDMNQSNYAVSIDITRKNPQTNEPNPVNSDIAMIKFIDCDFQDNGKGDSEKNYMVSVFGNNGMTCFENCRFKNTQRAIRISDKSIFSLFNHITRFESCVFENCQVGVDSKNTMLIVRDCVFNTQKKQNNQIKYNIEDIPLDTGEDYGTFLIVEGNLFCSTDTISSPYIDIYKNDLISQNLMINISNNIFNNTSSVPAINAHKNTLREERNIGKKILD